MNRTRYRKKENASPEHRVVVVSPELIKRVREKKKGERESELICLKEFSVHLQYSMKVDKQLGKGSMEAPSSRRCKMCTGWRHQIRTLALIYNTRQYFPTIIIITITITLIMIKIKWIQQKKNRVILIILMTFFLF